MPKQKAQYYKDGEYFDIPNAPYYVTSHDTFMSGWGPCEGKKNVCVVPCPDINTTNKVYDYVCTRSEQRKVFIHLGALLSEPNIIYSLVPEWIDRAKELVERWANEKKNY